MSTNGDHSPPSSPKENKKGAIRNEGSKKVAIGNEGSIDITSPLFLHASDQPGQLFVSELLNDGNYGEWVSDMSNALYAKNKIGFVDGSIPMPEVDSPNLAHWMRCSAMVKGWLKNGMDKEVRRNVRYAATAWEIWVELGERFAKGSAPRVYELRRAITHLRQEKQYIPSYYTKLKRLWDEIQEISPRPECKCGGGKCNVQKQLGQMLEREHLYDFLMGLDKVFDTVKTQILSMAPKMTLGHAYHLVAEDEQQRLISATQKPMAKASAFQMQNDRRVGNKERRTCDHCKKVRHTKQECWEIIGYPRDWKKPYRERKESNGSWTNKKG